MNLVWTKHLKTEEEKEKFKKVILSSKEVLKVLDSLLKEQEESLDRNETSLSAYDTPNWDYRQAHKNGYRSCISIVRKLINLDQKEI